MKQKFPKIEYFTPVSYTHLILVGIKRGLFSNEAGMGSAPNAAATADTSHPVSYTHLGFTKKKPGFLIVP